MTEQDIQNAIAALYESTNASPATTDEDYLTRRLLMNRALHRWERLPGFFWDSLWTRTAPTAVTSSSTYTAPADLRRAGGWVDVLDTDGITRLKRYPVIKPNDAQAKSATDTFAYFTGSDVAGRTLNLNPAPDSSIIGKNFVYNYYKKVTEYTAPTTISEIPDPEYIIHSVVAELWKGDNNTASYQTSLAEAEERLKGLQINQIAEIDWQDNTIPGGSDYGFGV